MPAPYPRFHLETAGARIRLMLKYAASFVLAVLVLAAFHCLGLWMERRGWVYYWRKRATSGAASAALGAAMQELNAFAEPQVRHVIGARQSDRTRREQFDGLDEDA